MDVCRPSRASGCVFVRSVPSDPDKERCPARSRIYSARMRTLSVSRTVRLAPEEVRACPRSSPHAPTTVFRSPVCMVMGRGGGNPFVFRQTAGVWLACAGISVGLKLLTTAYLGAIDTLIWRLDVEVPLSARPSAARPSAGSTAKKTAREANATPAKPELGTCFSELNPRLL